MGRRRDALLARFRTGSLARITDIGAKLGAEGEDVPSAETVQDLRAPLHTLKGEARMLGLTSLSALVHSLEDQIIGEGVDAECIGPVRAVVALIHERLKAPLVEDDDAVRALERGRAMLSGEPVPEVDAQLERSETSSPSSSPSPRPAPADEPESAYSLVRVDLIDELCERIEVLRVGVERDAQGSGNRSDEFRAELAELAELAWSLRLVPVEPALDALSEHASELARQLGKQLRVMIDAGGAQLERSLLERLQEPLVHLVRNAVDHGIETPARRGDKPERATLEIVARSVGAEVEIEVIDDGPGIDIERVRTLARERGLLDEANAAAAGSEQLLPMLFESGFSTSTTVSELSGRGVGLDAVRRVVEGLGGEVSLASQAGEGTRFTIRVPATISRETVVVVAIGQTLWGLPSRRVERVVALSERERAGASPTIEVVSEHLPLLSLPRLLGAANVANLADNRVAICCSHGGRRYALASPPVLGEFELFRRPMGALLASVGPASASAVMDDGRLVLLLEPAAILGRGRGRGRDTRERRAAAAETRPRVLVVDDSPIVRELMVELLTAAQLDVYTAGDGRQALEVLARRPVNLVLSDVEMPNMNGFEFLEALRKRDTELPVIMVTTRGSVADRERAAGLGADAYLVKSDFREQDLLDAVRRFVEVKR